MVKRRYCFYTSQNEYVKAPNLCICLPKPIDTHSKNVLSCSHRNTGVHSPHTAQPFRRLLNKGMMYAIRFRKTLAFPHGVRAGRRVAPVRGGRDVARGSGKGTERTPHPPCGNGSRRRVAGQPAARCAQRPAGRAPSACREIVSEEDPRFSAALCPERTFPHASAGTSCPAQ